MVCVGASVDRGATGADIDTDGLMVGTDALAGAVTVVAAGRRRGVASIPMGAA